MGISFNIYNQTSYITIRIIIIDSSSEANIESVIFDGGPDKGLAD